VHAPTTSAVVLASPRPLLVGRVCARLRRRVGRERLTRSGRWIQRSACPSVVLRVGDRLGEVSTGEPGADRHEFARSPLTLAVSGLLAGNGISSAILLAVWRARLLKAKSPRLQAERAGAGSDV
jgi:hypothetical protein